MRNLWKPLALIAIVTLLSAPSQAAWNDGQEYESKLLSNRWNVWVGGFLPDFKTEVAIGSQSLLGSLIRLEDTLGLEEDLSTLQIGGFYRFSKKRAILFTYNSLNRSATTILDTEFTWGDGDDQVTFEVGAQVDSIFDNDILTLTYRHSFINNGKTEAGFTAGVSAFNFDIEARGIASVDDGSGMPVVREAEGGDSILVPVPAVGMFINHAFSKNWVLRMQAGFLNLDVGDFEGRYLTTTVTVDWIFTKHFGLGLGLTRQDLDFSSLGGSNPYSVEYRVGGPLMYASMVF